jgi:hypothetical protein
MQVTLHCTIKGQWTQKVYHHDAKQIISSVVHKSNVYYNMPNNFQVLPKTLFSFFQANWVLNIVIGKVNNYLYLCAFLLGDESSKDINKFVSNCLRSSYMIITQCNKSPDTKTPHFQVEYIKIYPLINIQTQSMSWDSDTDWKIKLVNCEQTCMYSIWNVKDP